MSHPDKSARTFADWWHGDYAREHYLIGVLVGLLLGALIGLAVRVIIPAMSPIEDPVASTHETTLVRRGSENLGRQPGGGDEIRTHDTA